MWAFDLHIYFRSNTKGQGHVHFDRGNFGNGNITTAGFRLVLYLHTTV